MNATRPVTAPSGLPSPLVLSSERDVLTFSRSLRELTAAVSLPLPASVPLQAAAFDLAVAFLRRAPGTTCDLLAAGDDVTVGFRVRTLDGLGGLDALDDLTTSVRALVTRLVLDQPAPDEAQVVLTAAGGAGPAGLADTFAALTGVSGATLVNVAIERDGRGGIVQASLGSAVSTGVGQVVPPPSRRLQQLLDSVHDQAILMLTLDGAIVSANAGATRLFDCPVSEIVGRPFEMFYAADQRANLAAVHLVRAAEDSRLAALPLGLRRGAATFDAQVTFSELRDEQGVRTGFSVVARDISDRARLEADLRLRAEELAAANRAKEDFLATLSHELRTPLNAMLGWTRLLRMGKLDAAGITRALDTIERNAHIQEQLISDILDVSRIVTGKLRLTLRPVDLAPVLDAALDAVRPAADAKGVELTTRLVGTGGVLGDPDRLQQVVWNLLSNAIRFTPSGGTVTLVLDEIDDEAVVTVIDTGEGIGPELLPYIFDRFRQGDASVTRPHGGVGLGLAIVRHIVELHGGSVLARSGGRGQGAVFSVSLPLRQAHRVASLPSDPE